VPGDVFPDTFSNIQKKSSKWIINIFSELIHLIIC